LKPELEGIVLRLPRATKNFYVDGHKPTPHWNLRETRPLVAFPGIVAISLVLETIDFLWSVTFVESVNTFIQSQGDQMFYAKIAQWPQKSRPTDFSKVCCLWDQAIKLFLLLLVSQKKLSNEKS
jgi:hypothetical protein